MYSHTRCFHTPRMHCGNHATLELLIMNSMQALCMEFTTVDEMAMFVDGFDKYNKNEEEV